MIAILDNHLNLMINKNKIKMIKKMVALIMKI